MLTIGQDTRLWSADAFNAAAKQPTTTFQNVAKYLGQEFNEELISELKSKKFILNEFVQDERGLVAF